MSKMDSIAPILVCALIVVTFGALLLFLASLFGAKAKAPRTKAKSLPYECGLEEQEKPNSRVPQQFYLTALLFILFDIEIIFLYPWALTFKESLDQGAGLVPLVAMAVFGLVFVYGLIWEIGSNALKWK